MHGIMERRPAESDGDEARAPDGGLTRALEVSVRVARSHGDGDARVLLQDLIDQIPDFIFVKDVRSRFVIANRAITRAYGLQPNRLLGKTDHDLHPPPLAEEFLRHEQEVVRSGVPMFNMEESFPDSEGLQKFYSTTKVPLRNSDGVTIGLIGVARDITERKQMESFGVRQNAILEMIATNAPLTAVLTHLVLLIESQLPKATGSVLLFEAETGCLRHGAAPNLPDAYVRAIDGIAVGPSVGSCGTAVYRQESVVVADIQSDPLWDDYRHVAESFGLRSCWSTPIIAHGGAVLGTFAIYSGDVRTPKPSEIRLLQTATRIAGIAIERHRSEEQLLRMVHYDPLTGLPNRLLCLGRLRTALSGRRAKRCRIALHFIDLDDFKQVNDTFGHQVGDGVLRTVGARLQSIAGAEHTAARLAGDEFAVIQKLDLEGGREPSADLGAEIIRVLSEPYEIEGHRIAVGASIGIAIAPDDDEDPEALLRDADLALYRAKADERGGFRFFEPEMSVRAQQRRKLESDLRRALEDSEFELHYQPLVDLATNELRGFEALLRWNHPHRGRLGPSEFIQVAEEVGLIVPLGEWALRQACIEAALWPRALKVAVNLSPVQFKQPGLFKTVTSALSSSGLSAQRLELEITESVLLLDSETNLALLHQLRLLGVQISLDDFGTGYSSLSYLRSFPFTKIKIDRSFVRDLGESPGCLAIVRAVSRLASDLGMRTTAEGVETRGQLDELRLEGCDEGQGFLFSRPLPASEASALILRWPSSLNDAA